MSRRIRGILAGLLLAAAVAIPAAAQPASGDYTEVAAIFQIGMGARPLGMGGAFVGVADDENSLFYNPAGLARLRRSGLASLYSTQYGVMDYAGVGLAGGGFGLGGLFLQSAEIPGAGENSEILGNFDYVNMAGVLGLAVGAGPLSVGARGKYLQVTSATLSDAGNDLEEAQGRGLNVDAGALLKLGPLGLGVVYENLLDQAVEYSTGTGEPWERRLSAGASLALGPLLVAADLENLTGERRYFRAGVELAVGPLALRGGATGPFTEEGPDFEAADLTAGAGLRLGGLQLDYAYLMPETLPESHRLSLTLRF